MKRFLWRTTGFCVIMFLVVALALVGGFRKAYATSVEPGTEASHEIGGVIFKMRYAPKASFTSDDPVISKDKDYQASITVDNPFWIAETEVTYELWKKVYDWATADARGEQKYQFQYRGKMGGRFYEKDKLNNQHPVTSINWRDAMVWCNALTEYYNAENEQGLACVYTYAGQIVRDSTDSNGAACDGVIAHKSAKGFRLPTNAEWQLAARYQDGFTWTPGDHVSGDMSGPCWALDGEGLSKEFKDYAWYAANSRQFTRAVGQKKANALGIYDMSGNVSEWVFDLHPKYISRITRGAGWSNEDYELPLGYVGFTNPINYFNGLGFHVARTQ